MGALIVFYVSADARAPLCFFVTSYLYFFNHVNGVNEPYSPLA